MNTICSAMLSWWTGIYDACIASLDDKLRVTIGIILFVLSIWFFILCAKGKKSELVNNWFWFWICMITFIISVLYLSH